MRRVLAVWALLAYLLGIATICSLPIGGHLAVLAVFVWSLIGGAEWRLISSAHKRFCCVRLHSGGSTQLLDNSGEWHSAIVCNESIVLAKVAWLKLKTAQGGTYYELLRGSALGTSPENQQWRRLQVIWRHLGAAGRSC